MFQEDATFSQSSVFFNTEEKRLFLNRGQIDFRFLILILLMLFLAILAGRSISILQAQFVVALVCGLAIAIVAFVRTDIALMILIFSMLLSPELKLAEIPQRAVVVRIDDILLGVVFFTWLAKMAINKELGLLKSTPLNRPIAIYVLVCILATARGISTGRIGLPASSFYILKYVEYFMLYFMFVNNIRSKEQVKRFITILLVTCAIVCVYAWLHIGTGMRVGAPFEGPNPEANTLAGYLLFMMAIILGLLLYSKKVTTQFWLGALLCLAIVPFFYTLSRGAWLGLVPMCFVLIILTKKRKLAVAGILVLLLVVSPFIIPEMVKGRIMSTFIPGKEYEVLGTRVPLEPSASARIEMWKRALKKWMNRPLLGLGITGVGIVDSQYVRVIGELGIIGFGIFIWLLVAIFRGGLGVFRSTEDEYIQALSVGFLAGFVGLLIQALTANTFIIVRIMEPFWFLAAVVMTLPNFGEEEKFSEEV